jgi:hypothetical protein
MPRPAIAALARRPANQAPWRASASWRASGPLPATVWIEKDAPHQLVQAQVEQSAGNSVTLTLSEWDKPVTVTKPAM